MTREELKELEQKIRSAVAEAYAASTNEEIHEHVMQSVYDARAGRVGSAYEDEI